MIHIGRVYLFLNILMPAKGKNSSVVDSIVSPKGLVVFAVVLLVLAGGAYFYSRPTFMKRLSQIIAPSPTPTPRPVQHGKGSFSVSSNKKTGPTMSEIVLNPYDPANGAAMILRVAASNTEPIASVTAIMKTDHKSSAPINFSVVEGTATKGVWEGRWIADDTYLYEYTLIITEESTNGSFTNTLGLR